MRSQAWPIPGCGKKVVGLHGVETHCGSPLADLCEECTNKNKEK